MRGVGRASETAVRKALGASRFRLLRQHLTEGVTLWTLGGIGGTLLAIWLTRLMEGMPLAGRTAIADVPMDWRVLAFTALLSLIVGLLFSVLPARRAVRVEAAEMLKSAGSSVTRRRFGPASILTIVQLAASLTLVVGALLLARTLQNLGRVELGFDPRGVSALFVQPGMVGYKEAASYQYLQQFVQRLQARGGIESVALSQGGTPFFDANMSTRVRIMGDASNASLQRPRTAELWSTGYFETLRIPLVRGRLFTADDLGAPGKPARRVVILNEWLARDLFGSIDGAVGRSVEFRVLGTKGPCEVIGVVGNALYSVLTDERAPMVFEPAGLDGPLRTDATITIRSAPGIDAVAAAREIAASLDRSLPLGLVMTMEEAIDQGLAQWHVLARLLTALAVVAGVLSAIGLYAVVSFGVAARRREIGIRMALGAEPAVGEAAGPARYGHHHRRGSARRPGRRGRACPDAEEQPVRRAAIRSGRLDDRGGDSRRAGVCRLDHPRAARDACRRRGDAAVAVSVTSRRTTGAYCLASRSISDAGVSGPSIWRNAASSTSSRPLRMP